MENKFKGYMEKLKSSASQLVGDRQNEEERDTTIELSESSYIALRRRADRENVDVNDLAERAIRQFIAAVPIDGRDQVSLERKERNPLLYLDGLTRNLQ